MASSSPFAHDSQNPFFVPGQASVFAPVAASDSEHEATGGYAMIKSAPAVDANEVECERTALEIVVRWGDETLHMEHLSAAKSFTVGEAEGCDVVLPADRIGAARVELVRAEGNEMIVRIPANAEGSLAMNGQRTSLGELEAAGRLQSGERSLRLALGERLELELGGFAVVVAAVRAGKKIAGKSSKDGRAAGFAGLSALLHGGLVAAMFAFVPSLASSEDASMADEQAYRLLQAMSALQEKSQEETKDESPRDEKRNAEGGTGAPAAGESGKMGEVNSKATNRHYAMSGGAQERTLDRVAAIEEARNFGMAGMLASLEGGNPDAPYAVWGTEANGPDAMMANGNMWGDAPGEAGGVGGLGLSGIGEGGGGRFQAIGLGNIATVGRGSGSCTAANCQGFGDGVGGVGGGHKSKPPILRMSSPSVSGRIPPEVIQRVVRQSFGRFRGCYEAGLRNNPSLQGRVAVSFIIGRDGAVSGAQNGGSDLADSNVVSCVVRSFYGLSFPAPEGGVVRVTYPIMFSPG
jgi:hypothetical protein